MPLNSPQKVLYYRMFPALLKGDEAYMGLDALANGILFSILNHQCLNGSVPADPLALAGIVRATPDEVRRFLGTFTKLQTLEAVEGGPADRLVVPYLHRELEAIHALIEARRQAGAKGGKKTQAKARPARAPMPFASSVAQAKLEAALELPSSRQEQEQEEDKNKDQRDSSRQQQIHPRVNGHTAAFSADADGVFYLPADIQEGLSSLGIAASLGSDLCEKAGGVRGLRAALKLLEFKVQRKEIHSPSGFFLRCVGELAKEALACYEQALDGAMDSHRKALMDPRWAQLPGECRESVEVLQTWCAWWSLQERSSSAKNGNREGIETAAWEARGEFFEALYRHHPNRSEIALAIAEKQKAAGRLAESPGMAKRLRIGALASLLGLEEKAAEEPVPTPLNGVAS